MPIKGIIFDLDGTVTLTQKLHAQAFHEVFKNHGLNFTKEDDVRFSGQGSENIFPAFFKENGKILSPEQIKQLCDEKHEIYRKIIKESKIENVPGVEMFLNKVKEKGIKIGMATGNHLKPAKLLLKLAGLDEFFPLIITNKDVNNVKPAPDIFLKTAEKLGLKPEECLVLEDSSNGVKAAKNAKMQCIAFVTTTSKEQLKSAGADLIVNSYEEIPGNYLN